MKTALSACLASFIVASLVAVMPPTNAHAAEAKKVDMVGPFELSRTYDGDIVELTLTLAKPAERAYRYEVVINGGSNVRNAGTVGRGGRVGAVLCHLTFNSARPWSGAVTITDDTGRSETLRL